VKCLVANFDSFFRSSEWNDRKVSTGYTSNVPRTGFPRRISLLDVVVMDNPVKKEELSYISCNFQTLKSKGF
jgi:hypothetical protein